MINEEIEVEEFVPVDYPLGGEGLLRESSRTRQKFPEPFSLND